MVKDKKLNETLKKLYEPHNDPFNCKTCNKSRNLKIYGNMEVCSWSCYLVEFDKMKIEFIKRKKKRAMSAKITLRTLKI